MCNIKNSDLDGEMLKQAFSSSLNFQNNLIAFFLPNGTLLLITSTSCFLVQYHDTLTPESEIFLSLLMKFLDPDKPSWQNGSALEVIHKIVVRYLLQLVPFARHDLYLCLVVSHIFNVSFNLI